LGDKDEDGILMNALILNVHIKKRQSNWLIS